MEYVKLLLGECLNVIKDEFFCWDFAYVLQNCTSPSCIYCCAILTNIMCAIAEISILHFSLECELC